MPRRIVLDTDMGSDVDDALCLALAIASPEIDLVGVTHVSGDTTLRACISRKLLDLAGRSDIPVFAGRSDPLSADPGRFVWFGNEGKGILDHADQGEVEREDAVDALIRLLSEEEGLEVVAVGPMTNLAAAFRKSPEVVGRIARLTIMGGHLREISYGGRVFPAGVDYNLCSDGEASIEVLSRAAPIRLVTGDVTLGTWLTARGLSEISDGASALRAALVAAVREWTPIMRGLFGAGESISNDANVAFLHDPLALASVFDESFCDFEDLNVEPCMVDGIFRTLERSTPTPASFPMRCAVDVDAGRFHEFFVSRLRTL